MFTITLEEKINQKYEEMLPFFGRKKEEIKKQWEQLSLEFKEWDD